MLTRFGLLQCSSIPTASRTESAGSSKASSADEETSTWDEADEVAAEIKAKRKADREKRDAEKAEKREQEREERCVCPPTWPFGCSIHRNLTALVYWWTR